MNNLILVTGHIPFLGIFFFSHQFLVSHWNYFGFPARSSDVGYGVFAMHFDVVWITFWVVVLAEVYAL